MLEEAKTRGTAPTSIALYMTRPDASPDIAAWQRELGISLHLAGVWDWRTAPPDAGVSLVQQRQRWRIFSGMATRLRPAAWIMGAALTLHAVALVTDWTLLASDQRALRQQMETRFRTTFPDAVAVADPVLQMRRKLAEARHVAGLSDSGDFLPMIELVAAATKELPANAVRTVSYEGGRMTLELVSNEEAVHRISARLIQSGLNVETPLSTSESASKASSKVPARAANAKIVMIVRAS
jgi:general secretion pathway protein L